MATTKIPTTLQGCGKQQLELLTVKEACERLRISPWSFYQLVQRREIKTVKIGRRRLVTVAALEAFIEQRSEGNS